MSTGFVHLRLHSEFSVVDGLVRINDAVDAAVADGQGALALTDSANLFGAVRFYSRARKKGVKPIIGCDVWITNTAEREAPYRLLLLAADRTGYRNLCELLTRAWLENQHRGRAEMRLQWFAEGFAQGLIALSGGPQGEIGAQLASGNLARARSAATRLAELFPDRFYIELQRAGRPGDAAHVQHALGLAAELRLPVVATHPIQFLRRDEFQAHEARVCIAEGYTLGDPRRPRPYTEEQYLKTRAEMGELFADIPAALANSVEIAKRCNLELTLGKARLPDYPTPPGVTLDQHCRDLAGHGLERKLVLLYPDQAQRDEHEARYRARLDLELATIAKMGFSGYFLIVADFINWAKENGVPVGPGRGSGAGSLVAYSLGITDLDPLRYDLLFERFLNPERVSMPDFDIDFCQDNRDRVIDYVKRKYGAQAVCQIATFGTLGAKAVVRDVGRVLDLPYTKCDQLSKLIPHNPVDPWTLDRALADEPAFGEAVKGDEEYQRIIELARPLEGLTRNVGMHAGGVLIAPGKLTEFCPLYCAPGAQDAAVSQFDKDDVEAIGLVKFDFLGLTTLTILEYALEFVRNLDPSSALTLASIPLDDAPTYEVFRAANTAAIFQFESRGMRDLLKRAKPDKLGDLIALNALFRPGPMELIPDYVERKHGRQRVDYLDTRLKEILDETCGIMIYQEQVMRIAQTIGGYSLGGADLLRRAMGKKKPEEMAKHRSIFVEGAGRNGVNVNAATELFDLMEKFAGYGFNKCVVGATQLYDARSGTRHTVRELFDSRRQLDFVVHSLDDGWRMQRRRVRDVVWNGRKTVYELRTALGRRIVATDNHPFRTLDGWTLMRDLTLGARIAAPRAAAVTEGVRWPEHEVIALGLLLSEGNTCHPTCLCFYNNEPELIADFARAAGSFPNSVARVSTRRNARHEVCVSTGRDTRFRKGQRPWSALNVAPALDAVPLRSGAFLWAGALGLLGRRADQKRVPAVAFELADEDIAILLGRMWSGDGFFYGPSNSVPYYATSSEGLARDTQDLLLRLGIVSRIQAKQFRYRDTTRPGFAVYVLGEGGTQRFIERIAPHCVGRDRQIEQLKDRVASVAAGISSKDTVPASIRSVVASERARRGMTWAAVEQASGVSMREFSGNGSRLKRGFRRATVARLARFLGSDSMRAVAESDVYWDTVVAIVPRGIEDVYDLEVEGDHNFVADGLFVHNSHSAAYAVVAFQTAYFKRHHPAAFFAANMSAIMGDTDKVKELVEDAKTNGIAVLAPDINTGSYRFEPIDAKSVRYGLGGIKGTGAGAIEAIIGARTTGGPFRDLFDLCGRVDKHVVNRRVVEALVRAGALDALNPDRATLLASVGRAMESAERALAHAGQESLFGDPAQSSAPAHDYVHVKEWTERERLANEKLALGFYFSGHLFTEFEQEARKLAPTRLADAKQGGRDSVRLAGIIVSARSQNTRRGRMGVIVLDDGTAQLELMVFSELYDRKRALLKEDTLVFVTGKVRFDDFNQRYSISADDVMDLGEARARAEARLRIELDSAMDVASLKGALQAYRIRNGTPAAPPERSANAIIHGCRVVVGYRNGEGSVDVTLPEEWRVRPDENLIAELKAQPRVRSAYFNYG